MIPGKCLFTLNLGSNC